MALYTEISNDDFARMQQMWDEENRRKAAQEYNARKSKIDEKYNNDGGLGGFLGGIVGSIGKFVGDTAKGVGGLFGTAGASVKDLLEGKAGTAENTNAFKRYWYGGKDDADAAAKAAGTSLNAATNIATSVIPGLGAGGAAAKAAGGVAANTAAGALGGVADELQDQGSDASIESATNRALSGAAAGLATGGLNRKIGNAGSKVGSALLNNKLATSTIGRGALSGAVGGATGSATSAALGGGDIGQAALQGATSGAIGGATQAGIMSGVNRLGQKVANRNNRNIATTTGTEPEITSDGEFRAYGDSELANRTKVSKTTDALRRFGNTLEGTQSNITRAAARDLGIDNPGSVIENVRNKTGIRNLETQAKLAKELTGGQNSLMDTVQKNALSATEDGSNGYLADTTKLLGEVESIVKKYANRTNMKGQKGVENLVNDVRNDILSRDTDLINKANNFKASAAELRGKGIVNPSEGDSAKAKIYSEIAAKLDDLSYSAIPKENVNDMFDVTIGEMRSRANQAAANGDKQIATAYNTLADKLDQEPRTIKAYRSFKKDFVDVSKIDQLTARAENGAAQNLGNSAAGIPKKVGNMLLQRPVNAGLSAVGAGANVLADVIDNSGIGRATGASTPTQPLSQSTNVALGNTIGRLTGQMQASDAVQNARREQEYQNLEDMFPGVQTSPQTASTALTGNMMGGYGSMAQSNPLLDQMNQISNAMGAAMAAGDVTAYNQLADLYKTAYNTYAMQEKITGGASGSTANMSTQEKNQIAKLESAGTALDQLESLFKKAGGGQGIIGGNLANFLGGLGINSDVSTYNQLAQGLINQIGAAIGKTDALNTEGEVQRALSLVPKLTDTNETAQNKLATLRALLQENKGTYNQLYGA